MRFTYQVKLTIVITALSVVLTAVSMGVIFNISHNMMFDRINKNLVDVGRLGGMLLDAESIAAIKRLKVETDAARILTHTEILHIPYGQIRQSLPDDAIERLHASSDFQLLVKKLTQISVASLHSLDLHQDSFQPEQLNEYFSEGMIDPYLMVPITGFPPDQYFQYLVSPTYESLENGWVGCPIGTISHAEIPIDALLEKSYYVSPELISDAFSTSASAMIIFKEDDGTPIAALGVDYPLGSELDKLKNLRNFSLFVVLCSGVFGYCLSRFISRRMSRSLHRLRDAALLIEQGHYGGQVGVLSDDEFGQVATAFNRMARVVGETLTRLKSSNERLRSVTVDMHDGVGTVLTGIRLGTSPETCMDRAHVHRLAGQGLEEIRFLMDALEYEQVDLSLLEEGFCLLCADFLDPHDIAWRVELHGTADRSISFQFYLDLQRIVCEALTNIIKHSSSQTCAITLRHEASSLAVTIVNEGSCLAQPLEKSGGRGLDNMRYRVERHSGTFSIAPSAKGYRIELNFGHIGGDGVDGQS
jgi:signal transduction histidine kinase